MGGGKDGRGGRDVGGLILCGGICGGRILGDGGRMEGRSFLTQREREGRGEVGRRSGGGVFSMLVRLLVGCFLIMEFYERINVM